MKNASTEQSKPAFGEPADLTDWRTAVRPRWIVHGFLQEGALSLLSGQGGIGKSLLVLDLAVRLASGERGRWLDHLDIQTADDQVVALLDGECGADRIKIRLRELELGRGLTETAIDEALAAGRLLYFGADEIHSRTSALNQLEDLVDTCRPKIVIVDPLRYFLPSDVSDENDNIALGKVLDEIACLASRKRIAALVIDHDSKNGAPCRGASAKQDVASYVAHLKRLTGRSLSRLILALEKQRDPCGIDSVEIAVHVGEPTAEGLRPLRFASASESRRSMAAQGSDPYCEAVRRLSPGSPEGVHYKDVAGEVGKSPVTAWRELRKRQAQGDLSPGQGAGRYLPREQPSESCAAGA